MKAVHIPRRLEAEIGFPGAVIVGPQVWADSFRADSTSIAESTPDAVADAFDRLAVLLERAGSGLDRIAKLDAYVESAELAEQVRAHYRATFAAPRPVLHVQVADVWGPDPVLLDTVAATRA